MNSPSIFISYRRSDSAALAGRVQEKILKAIPDAKVFLDVNTIEKGDNFRTSITRHIEDSEVFLVLIGRNWLVLDEALKLPRVCSDEDYVRYEISWALKNQKTIIPILIDGATMPDPQILPEDIRSLTLQNAAEIRHSRFSDDMNSLLEDLGRIFSVSIKTDKMSLRKIFFGIAIGAVLGLLTLLLVLSVLNASGKHTADYIGQLGPSLLIPIAAIIGGYSGFRFMKR